MPYKLISYGINPPRTLQHSSTDIVKVFDTFEDASAMKDELNTITVDSVQWEVISVSEEKNRDKSSEKI